MPFRMVRLYTGDDSQSHVVEQELARAGGRGYRGRPWAARRGPDLRGNAVPQRGSDGTALGRGYQPTPRAEASNGSGSLTGSVGGAASVSGGYPQSHRNFHGQVCVHR